MKKHGSDTSTYGTSGSQRGYLKNVAMATELRDIESAASADVSPSIQDFSPEVL